MSALGFVTGAAAALLGVAVGYWVRGQAEPYEPRRHGVELVDGAPRLHAVDDR